LLLEKDYTERIPANAVRKAAIQDTLKEGDGNVGPQPQQGAVR
jgi:hypothetical protein